MLIAEDLILLLTDAESGAKRAGSTEFSYGLAGAVLLDLSLMGRVDVAEKGEAVRAGRLIVRDHSPTGESILDLCLERISTKQGRKPQDVINSLSKHLGDDIYARLSERGVLRAEESKVLGMFPRTRWLSTDPAYVVELRGRIVQALAHPGVTVEPRVGALVSLLFAIGKVTMVAPPAQVGVTRRELKKRSKDIAAQGWAPKAVQQAVAAVNVAIIAGVTAATAGAAAASS